MKRLVWIALAMAAGVVVALMIASLLLQQQAGKVVDDLRAPVASLRKALLAWDRQRVRECTDGVSDEDYSRWFDDYNSGNPVRRGRIEGVFASMSVFPSVRFDDVRPDRVLLEYEVHDGASHTLVRTMFTTRAEGGWALRGVRFAVGSDDNSAATPIAFDAGDNAAVRLSLTDTADQFFNSLMSPEAFRSFMGLGDNETVQATRLLDDTRAQVMACGSDRLKRILPTLESLPRGTLWLRIVVNGVVDEKALHLDFAVELRPGREPNVRRFLCSAAPGRETPKIMPAPADNTTGGR